MSYQVLARKWRPNRFAELVGQEHVVSAISNALDNNRLHHAYLFTGTRGVGKTTIARIFSKSLNCEQGLGATPCGQCGTCVEIENGNFIDLLEIDAASRTKVEDTRELLDNVQYKPSRGRYKVYLIDEVHMLSKHSFNALLKTLEEPPPHVKFLLATTDPQKLPVTILSRCLQFNLKALSRAQITQQLDYVLNQENIQFEKDGISQLSRAAQGSMRDALSLTDQAIAQGNGVVSLQIVTDMLGLMDKNQVLKLVHAVVKKDSVAVMQQVEKMASQAPDFSQILSEIMSLLHQVALTQFVPDACKLETISARAIYQLANAVPAEQIQLLYQIALSGRKDLPHAADARIGLEMTLLRMLAFCPTGVAMDSLDIAEQSKSHGTIPDSSVMNKHAQSQEASAEIDSKQPEESSGDTETVASEFTQPESVQSLGELADSVSDETQSNGISEIDEPSDIKEQDLQPNIAAIKAEIEPASDIQSEQALFFQQQEIMQQAESYGHHNDYNELQPVTHNEQPVTEYETEQFYAQPSEQVLVNNPENDHHSTADMQQAAAQPSPAATSSATNSTEDLIALRNRLKQSQSREEDDTQQAKKSDGVNVADLSSVRQQASLVENEPALPIVNSQPASEPKTVPEFDSVMSIHGDSTDSLPPEITTLKLVETKIEHSFDSPQYLKDGDANQDVVSPNMQDYGVVAAQKNTLVESNVEANIVSPSQMAPPWDVAGQDDAPPFTLPEPSQVAELEEASEPFDPNAHLDEDNVGDVTLDVPAFLDNKQKVLRSNQLDEWSQLIDDMQINALTKQLALHSSFAQTGNKVSLTLLEGKEHLDTETARRLLQEALSKALNLNVELEITMGQPINTPYAVQIKINQVRQEYACQVVADDPGIQLLQQRFAANVDQQSIQAR